MMLNENMVNSLENNIEELLGIKLQVVQTPPTSMMGEYQFIYRDTCTVPVSQNTPDKVFTVFLSHIRKGILEKIKSGSLFTKMVEDHKKEIDAFEEELKDLRKYKVFYDKLKEVGLNVPDLNFLDVPEERRLKLVRDGSHGDWKTVSVFPQRWPIIPSGTTVEFVKLWHNCEGTQVRVKYLNELYDVSPQIIAMEDREKIKQ